MKRCKQNLLRNVLLGASALLLYSFGGSRLALSEWLSCLMTGLSPQTFFLAQCLHVRHDGIQVRVAQFHRWHQCINQSPEILEGIRSE